MNVFRTRSPETPKTPPASPSSKRGSRVLFRSQSGTISSGKAPEAAPESSKRTPPLGIANVANIFIKMRRANNQVKPWHIQSSSGDAQSHPGVLEAVTSPTREPVHHMDTFVCEGAVNVVQLLRATRNALLEDAEFLGGNALLDEQWNCTICGPKHRPNGTFKVQISYSASAARSDRPDPHRPVALDKVKGVPGLMTIIKRITE